MNNLLYLLNISQVRRYKDTHQMFNNPHSHHKIQSKDQNIVDLIDL